MMAISIKVIQIYFEQNITTNIAHKTRSVESADYPSSQEQRRPTVYTIKTIPTILWFVTKWLYCWSCYLNPDWIISRIDLKVRR